MKSVLIRGGRLIDPTHRVDAVRDIVVRDGVIAAPLPGETFADYTDRVKKDAILAALDWK